MSALRTSPDVLRVKVAALAVATPIPPHHRTVYAIMARAKSASPNLLTEGDRWFLNSVLRLSSLGDRQQARLNDIAVRIERRWRHG